MKIIEFKTVETETNEQLPSYPPNWRIVKQTIIIALDSEGTLWSKNFSKGGDWTKLNN